MQQFCPECRKTFWADDRFCQRHGDVLKPFLLDTKFQILGSLGDGGYGDVYRGLHVLTGVEWAIKVLRPPDIPEESLEQRRERFLREVRNTARVRNRHIIQVTDAAFCQVTDQFYLVMELLEGTTLSNFLKSHPGGLNVSVASRIFDQLCEGVTAIHGRGIVHRDLKPDNIMLIEGNFETLKIIDFGIAKDLHLNSGTLTQTGAMIGTPRYMAPEQWDPDKDQDSRVDVFSLGLILFEMLTGRLPDERMMNDLRNLEIHRKNFSVEFRELRKLAPSHLSDKVLKVIHQSLQNRRERRFPTVQAFRDAFLLSLENENPDETLEYKSLFSAPAAAPPTVQPESVLIVTAGTGGVPQTIVVGAGIEVVHIPPGEFTMGSLETEEDRAEDEFPHRVMIADPFWIGKFQVTLAQWESVMGKKAQDEGDGPNCPVVNVSWDDCQRFVSRLNGMKDGNSYALPTEAQWEYACRAGTVTPFSFGTTVTPDEVNYNGGYPYGAAAKGLYRKRTTTVGSFSANAFGLHDMHGNVWEWCADWYGDDYYKVSPSRNPNGPASGEYRVLRGGSWYDPANRCRSACRDWFSPTLRSFNLGLRIVVTPARTR